MKIGARVMAENFRGVGIVIQIRLLRREARVEWNGETRVWHCIEDLRQAGEVATAPEPAAAGEDGR